MLTKAQWIQQYGDDGQVWRSRDGVPMEEFAAGQTQRERVTVRYQQIDRYVLVDGAVIATEGGWYFQHPDCTCGGCWEGAGEPRCIEALEEDY